MEILGTVCTLDIPKIVVFCYIFIIVRRLTCLLNLVNIGILWVRYLSELLWRYCVTIDFYKLECFV